MSEWPIGLSTGCFFRTSILDCLEPILKSGFSIIEICSFPDHLDYHNAVRVREAASLIRALSLDPHSFHAPFSQGIDITSPHSEKRDEALKEMLAAADAAAELGCRYFVIHPGPEFASIPENERPRRMENGAATLTKVCLHCRTLGLRLVLENMLPHLFSGHVKELMWLLGAMPVPDVGLCLDTGHALLSGDLLTAVQKLSGHLWLVHASDNNGRHDDHLPPGQGSVPWDQLLSQLARLGFKGSIMLEISGDGDLPSILQEAQQGRQFLRRIKVLKS